eukprot:XP_001691405.1 predicted protein [Chlamydomonas reinhardtii]
MAPESTCPQQGEAGPDPSPSAEHQNGELDAASNASRPRQLSSREPALPDADTAKSVASLALRPRTVTTPKADTATAAASPGPDSSASGPGEVQSLLVANSKLVADRELLAVEVRRLAAQVQHLTAQQGLLQGELQRLLSKNTSLNSTLASAVTTSESQAELLDILNEAVRSTVLVDEHAQQLVAVWPDGDWLMGRGDGSPLLMGVPGDGAGGGGESLRTGTWMQLQRR